MLVELAQALDAKGSELLLVVPPGSRVERTIRLLRLESCLRIFPKLDDAWAVQRPLVGIEN